MTDATIASAIVQSMSVWERKPADFYPTPHDVTVALDRFLIRRGLIRPGERILEPACGDGQMAAVLDHAGYAVTASDLREGGYGLQGIDFLAADWGQGQYDWLITNPPFNLSVEFILKALSICPNVAMLLKSQYWHAATRLPLFDQVVPNFNLPLTWRPAFLAAERGKSPLMDVSWVVWTDRDKARSWALPEYDGIEWDTAFRPLPRPKDSLEPPSVFEVMLRKGLI